MAELAALQIKVTRDGISQAKKELDGLTASAINAENAASGVGSGFDGAGKKTKSFANDMMAAGKLLGAAYIAKQIGDISIASLQASAAMEQQKVAFTTMLGSVERANTLLAQMQEFAGSTPFSFNEVVDAGKRLVAFGFDASSVVGNLTMLGDVAAGLSQPVGDMVYLFGQIKTQGRAMTQDLMQFANRGVPIYDELAKVLGVSTSQVKEFASQGKIGFKEIEQVFKNMTAEGGKFGGLMAAQAQTLAGKWSNFGDNLDRIKVTIGDELAPAASSFLDLLIRITESDMSQQKREMDDIVNKTQELLKYEEQYGVEKMNQSGFKDDLVYMERMKGIHIDINKTAKERLEIYKNITDAMTAATSEEVLYSNDAHGRAMKLKYGSKTPAEGATGKDGKGTGSSGASEWANSLKYVKSILQESQSEAEKLNLKYDEQMAKLEGIKDKAKVGGETYNNVIQAELTLTDQLNKDLEAVNEKLTSWEEKLSGSLKNKLKDLFPVQQAKVFSDLLANIVAASITPLVDGFTQLGVALSDGAVSGKEFKTILTDIAMSILKMLPMLFIQAGLMLIASNPSANLGVGLGLIAAGLSTAIVGGLAEGMRNESESESETANAKGNVYGFARGGSFTNEVVNSPTRFMFSSGGGLSKGLMGENGPEAIMPLSRGANGVLGVQASGGGSNIEINIINNSSEKVETKQSEENGKIKLDVIIGNLVNSNIVSGKYDSAMKQRYSLSPRGV